MAAWRELPKSTATGIVGAYGGLVYLSTVLGGWIADRLLGPLYDRATRAATAGLPSSTSTPSSVR